MARNRTISPDFWTWEAVIDCAPMTRLLFLGLWNFADDFGVQPLRPRTIRMQVLPGDEVGNDAVRAMIDELAARGLVRTYEVGGQEYLAIVDWALHQRVSRRARRRYPPDPSMPEPLPAESSGPADTTEPAPSDAPPAVAEPPGAAPIGEREPWWQMVKDVLRQRWPHHARIEMIDDEAAGRWTAKWIDEGCDIGDDIVPAVRDYYVEDRFRGPPGDLQQLDDSVTGYRLRRQARERARVAA